MLAGLLFSGIRKYLDRIQDKENIDAIVTQIEDWGGEVGYDIPTPRNWAENIALWCETVAMGKEFTAQPVAVEISAYAVKDDRWLWGALIDGRVDVVPTIAQLPSLRRVMLKEVRLRERNVAQLSSLVNLEVLYLETNDIDGQWLSHLSKLSKLQELAIRFNDIQDDDLRYLQTLTNLKELYLDGTPVTTAGLSDLVLRTNLQHISWREPYLGVAPVFPNRRQLTDAESSEIRALLPKCQIHVEGPIQQLSVIP